MSSFGLKMTVFLWRNEKNVHLKPEEKRLSASTEDPEGTCSAGCARVSTGIDALPQLSVAGAARATGPTWDPQTVAFRMRA